VPGAVVILRTAVAPTAHMGRLESLMARLRSHRLRFPRSQTRVVPSDSNIRGGDRVTSTIWVAQLWTCPNMHQWRLIIGSFGDGRRLGGLAAWREATEQYVDLGLNFDAPFHSLDIAVPPKCDFGRCPRVRRVGGDASVMVGATVRTAAQATARCAILIWRPRPDRDRVTPSYDAALRENRGLGEQ
jgi:hypothetical protein